MVQSEPREGLREEVARVVVRLRQLPVAEDLGERERAGLQVAPSSMIFFAASSRSLPNPSQRGFPFFPRSSGERTVGSPVSPFFFAPSSSVR